MIIVENDGRDHVENSVHLQEISKLREINERYAHINRYAFANVDLQKRIKVSSEAFIREVLQ